MSKDEPCVWRTLAHLASALEYLHGRRPRPVLHRDIKPDNILGRTTSNGNLVWKLADFGIARLLNQRRAAQYYARTCVGTVIYMAPEVFSDATGASYGTPADVWSLGAVASFYCSDGKHLFRSETAVRRWGGGKSSLDRGRYSIGLRQAVADMLCPNPALRPSAAKVLEAARAGDRQKTYRG